MSFLFDGTNDNLTGQFGTTYATVQMTLACFVKFTDHPAAQDCLIALAPAVATNNDAIAVRLSGTDNTYEGLCFNNLGTAATSSFGTANYDGVWLPIVFVLTTDQLRDIYVGTITNTGQNTLLRASVNVDEIICGEIFTNAQDFAGRLAELAVWNTALSSGDITAYLAGTAASSISAANLVGYWPMSTNSLLNIGLDSAGDLTASGAAAFDADHPTITTPGASVKKRRISLMGIG